MKRTRVTARELPIAVIGSCIAPFATTHDLFLDWPLVCRGWRDGAVQERKRRFDELHQLMSRVVELTRPVSTSDWMANDEVSMDHVLACLCVLVMKCQSLVLYGKTSCSNAMHVAMVAMTGLPKSTHVLLTVDETEARRLHHWMLSGRFIKWPAPSLESSEFSVGSVTVTRPVPSERAENRSFDVAIVSRQTTMVVAAYASKYSSRLICDGGAVTTRRRAWWQQRDFRLFSIVKSKIPPFPNRFL